MGGRGYIASLLWPANGNVLTALADRGFRSFVTIDVLARPELVEELGKRGAVLRDLHLGSQTERASKVNEETDRRLSMVMPHLQAAVEPAGRFATLCGEGHVAAHVGGLLRDRMRASIGLVDALQQFHEREGITALLLNETETLTWKTAALWAGSVGIPRFLLMHGANVTRHYTVSGQRHAEWILTFGERGFEPLLEDGVERAKLAATGNPAWDRLTQLARFADRDAYRAHVIERCGARDLPTVLFATTWRAKLTALEDSRRVTDPTVCFLNACKLLQAEGFEFNVCVKGRVSNNAAEGNVLEDLARSFGVTNFYLVPPAGDTPVMILGCTALVASDSNASIEAALLGVPTVNIWGFTSWLMGPTFGAGDGIAQVRYDQPAELAEHLRELLFDPQARSAAVAQAGARAASFNAVGPETATERVANFIASALTTGVNGDGTQQRFAWQELSSPQDERTKGTTQEYYDNPRHELIALFTHQPRRVVDVGCGGGATGAEIKRRFPSTEVIGVELNAGAAAWASKRIDRVINDNVETLEWAAHGLEPDSIDTVLFPDVLEHLRDPWNTLVRIKPFLAPDARVFASIPNVRNLWLLMQLVRGNFTYEHEGLLDVTHIRFFTLREVQRLFHETGYEVEHIGSVPDGRTAALNSSFEGTTTVRGERLTLTEMTQRDVQELKTLQFLVRAKPIA